VYFKEFPEAVTEFKNGAIGMFFFVLHSRRWKHARFHFFRYTSIYQCSMLAVIQIRLSPSTQ
jgi:hypothetical protein